MGGQGRGFAWTDRLTLTAVVAGLVLIGFNAVRAETWLVLALSPVAAGAGFLASSFMEWLRLYVLWHPKEPARRGDEAALKRIDRVTGIVLVVAGGAVAIASLTRWGPFQARAVAAAAALGFFLHQYLPDAARPRAQRVTGPLFSRLFERRLSHRRN